MKPTLACTLDCGITITAKSLAKENANDSVSYRISLFSSAAEDKELAGKDIPWPSQEQHPNEIVYSEEENSILLKSPTTIASLPVKLTSFLGGSSVASCDGARVYKSFSTNPVTKFDSATLVNAIKKAIQNKESSKAWKVVLKEISAINGQLSGVIQSTDQFLLISALQDIQEDSLLAELCQKFSETNAFSYRYQDKFYSICSERKLHKVFLSTLESNAILPEQVFGYLLKYATSLPSNDGWKVVKRLLEKGFSETAISTSGLVFNATEFSKFVDWLRIIFNDIEHAELADKLLSLLSSLIDSNSSSLIWDSETHPIVLELMEDIADMTSLCDSYFNLQVELKKKNVLLDDAPPTYRIRKLNLASRKVTW